jgi:hypothetical protein
VASHTISGQVWPSGTTVSVYPAAAQPAGSEAAPAGTAVTSAVQSGASVTFTGLAENVRYVAYASGVSRRFLVPPVDPMERNVLTPALGSSSTPDLSNHFDTLVSAVLTADLTVGPPTNAVPGATVTFDLTQDAVTARTVTWFSASQPAGSIGAIDPTLGSRTVVSFYTPDGTTWVGWSTRLGTVDTLRSKRYYAESAGSVVPSLQSAVSGTGASVAANASHATPNDACGTYDITCRSTPAPAAGDVLNLAFTAGYVDSAGVARRPRVFIEAHSAAAADARLYVAPFTTLFTLRCRVAPAASDVLTFSYWVIG